MSEQEPTIPSDQVAILLCQELEDCIESYLPQDDQSGGVDQQEVEQVQVEPRVDQPRDELALQLYNRSVDLLVAQGFEKVLSQALTDSREYHNNLLMRHTTQTIDVYLNVPGSEEGKGLIRDVFNKLLQGLHQGPLTPPEPQKYCDHFPSPYDELFTGVFLLDTLLNRARYVESRKFIRQKLEGRLAE